VMCAGTREWKKLTAQPCGVMLIRWNRPWYVNTMVLKWAFTKGGNSKHERLPYISINVWTIHNWMMQCLSLLSAVPPYCMHTLDCAVPLIFIIKIEQLGQCALIIVQSLLMHHNLTFANS
jgi:hypothetical protein